MKEKSKYMIERIVVKLIEKQEKKTYLDNYLAKSKFNYNKEIMISSDSDNYNELSDFSDDNEIKVENVDNNFAGWVNFDTIKYERKYAL